MGKYYDELCRDVRFVEGLHACMNCGACTAVCPAAEYYCYDPRQIVDIVQDKDDRQIEELMRSDAIWYCGQCMSCRPRCPRGNTPGYVIQALRGMSQKYGFFTDSEKGRQQLALKRTIGQNILDIGYCIHPKRVMPEMHPEQGPVWQWIHDHNEDLYPRFSENYDKEGEGAFRKIDAKSMAEINSIFEVSGGNAFFENIEKFSKAKAQEMGMTDDEYMNHIYTTNNGNHS